MNIDSINDRDPELSNAISHMLKVIQQLFVDPLYEVYILLFSWILAI